jgi:hypothetical protein
MRASLKLFGAAVLALGFAAPSEALVITPSTPHWEGNVNNTPVIEAAIAAIIGNSTELYKAEVDGGEEGSYQGSYETEFFNTPTDPMDATITYVGGSVIPPTAYALIKDGNAIPAWYLFNLTALGWNGTEILQFQGFWPGTGAISHVSLYSGRNTPPPDVSSPDGGSMAMLLGMSLMGIAAARRMWS